jgi:four helix bundle protein
MDSPRKTYFDHEKLDVYQEAIQFVAWVTPILESLSGASDVKDHLGRASTSMPLNIAEGNGKYSAKDRCRYFDSANGSAFECAAGLDVLVAKGKLTPEQIEPGKERLSRIVRMLVGLIKSVSERDYPRETRRVGG